MRESTAVQVLSALHHYDLKAKPGGRYMSNSPFRPGSNSHALSVVINGPEHGAYVDFVSGDKGSLYELAAHLGIETPKRDKAERTLVATYDYVNEKGELLYQACRFEPGKNGKPKDFTQRVPNGADWAYTMDGVTRVLYRLPEVLTAVAKGVAVYIVEGEKDADLLTMYGLVATTNVAGAGKWRPEYSEALRGAQVVILPDNDQPGAKHAMAVASSLYQVAANVRLVVLPELGPKGDVSDWIASGHTIDELLTVVAAAVPQAAPVEAAAPIREARGRKPERIELLKHPVTGQPLYLPPGYITYSGHIMKSDESNAKHLYSGTLAITETGSNPHTKEESVTVIWERNRALCECTVPRIALTTGARVAEAIGMKGAYVSGGNSRDVSRYLTEFLYTNEADMPTFYQIDRLGNVGDGLVLPAGSIGIDREVRYNGPEVAVGTDHDAYPEVLREVAQWDGMITFWATFALVLAGPILNRIRHDRQPVLLLANASGSGKTTVVHFATGAYGDPNLAPLRIQCASPKTTTTGILQTLAQVNGVPLHLEDIHLLMKREPDKFAGLIYDFANGQLRTFGGLNQKAGGGTRLGGAMIMTGEAIPQLEFEGSQRRLMTINCHDYLPLAVPAKSEEGGMRAEVLTSAWKSGAGSFGYRTCERVWANWDAFQRDAALLQVDPALGGLQAWKPLLATAVQTLRCALEPLGIRLDWGQLLRQCAAIYLQGQASSDPAQSGFEKVLMLLSQCERTNNSERSEDGIHRSAPTWEWLMYERKMVAGRRIGDGYWRVMTTSPQWKAVIGESAVSMFGTAWLQAGLIQPQGKDSKKPLVSDTLYLGPGKGYLQCIRIPETHLPISEPVG